MVRETLLDFFQDFAGIEKPFLVYDDGFRVETYTYAGTAAKARGVASYLRQSGIAPGEKIIIYSENRPEWIFVLWGAILAGVVVVPIDYRSSTEFVERIKNIVEAKWVYTGQPIAYGQAAVDTAATSDTVAEIIFTSGATAEPKGRPHHAPQRACKHRSGGARGAQVS